MQLYFEKRFIRKHAKLTKQIQQRADKQIKMLMSNPQHPSLRMKKLKGFGNLWEISVSMSYRILFQIEGDTYILTDIGAHEIVDEE